MIDDCRERDISLGATIDPTPRSQSSLSLRIGITPQRVGVCMRTRRGILGGGRCGSLGRAPPPKFGKGPLYYCLFRKVYTIPPDMTHCTAPCVDGLHIKLISQPPYYCSLHVPYNRMYIGYLVIDHSPSCFFSAEACTIMLCCRKGGRTLQAFTQMKPAVYCCTKPEMHRQCWEL